MGCFFMENNLKRQKKRLHKNSLVCYYFKLLIEKVSYSNLDTPCSCNSTWILE